MSAVAPSRLSKSSQPQGRGAANLRVVVPARDSRRCIAMLLVVASLGVFGVVSLNALAAESAFEAQKLEQEVSDLSVRYEELTAEVATLEAPARVSRIAVENLGMVPADDPGYLLVRG
ncbi:MAG: cell division protein FtsL [Egibacteraceae bacterium]